MLAATLALLGTVLPSLPNVSVPVLLLRKLQSAHCGHICAAVSRIEIEVRAFW